MPANRRRVRRNLLSILLVPLLLYAVLCLWLAKGYLSPIRTVPSMPPGGFADGRPMPPVGDLEEVLVPTAAGPNPTWATAGLGKSGEKGVVFVFAHGYGGDRSTWGELMQDLSVEYGYQSIAPAMPGQDASPDPTVGFGLKEAAVLVQTAEWVRAKHPGGDPKIVYVGLSMGGAAAWLASERDPKAAGVITEGAFAEFEPAMRRFFDRKAPGSSVYLRPVVWMASAMSGLQPASVRPVDSARKWRGRPALVIQGEADTLITMDHAEALAEAAGAEIWKIPHARHAHGQDAAGWAYVDRLVRFAKSLDD